MKEVYQYFDDLYDDLEGDLEVLQLFYEYRSKDDNRPRPNDSTTKNVEWSWMKYI